MLKQVLCRVVRPLGTLAQVAPASIVGTWYAYAAAADPDRTPYDLSFLRASLAVVGTSLSAWLAERRSKAALPVGLATAAVTGAMSGVVQEREGHYVTSAWPQDARVREVAFNKVMPVVQAGLGLAGLLAPIAAETTPLQRLRSHVPQVLRAQWPALRRLGLYYMTFSLLGHWGEMLFCTAIKHGLVGGDYDRSNHMLWDQWLFPFPAEGTVAVLAALFLLPAKTAVHDRMRAHALRGHIGDAAVAPLAVAATFLLNQAVCTSIDYTTGLVANRNFELWDYRDMPFNFQGQICLQNSLIYSAIATWAVWRLLPRTDALMERVRPVVLDGVFVGLGSLFVFLELLYHALPPGSGQGTIWDEMGDAQVQVAENSQVSAF